MRGVFPAYAEPSHRVKGQRKTYATAVPEDQPCPECGQIMGEHEKCAACRILVGLGHTDERLRDGLCAGCCAMRRQSRQGAAQVAAAIGRNRMWE